MDPIKVTIAGVFGLTDEAWRALVDACTDRTAAVQVQRLNEWLRKFGQLSGNVTEAVQRRLVQLDQLLEEHGADASFVDPVYSEDSGVTNGVPGPCRCCLHRAKGWHEHPCANCRVNDRARAPVESRYVPRVCCDNCTHFIIGDATRLPSCALGLLHAGAYVRAANDVTYDCAQFELAAAVEKRG